MKNPETHEPEQYCVSVVHPTPRVASWVVDIGAGEEVPFCSVCHFLLKREDRVVREHRLHVATLSFDLPANLSLEALAEEVSRVRIEAEADGYWGESNYLYQIKNIDGAVRVTFRRG